MKNKYVLLFAFVLLSFVIAFSACQKKTGGSGGGNTQSVKIGAVLPLTGGQATTGNNLKAAMEVAVDIINNEHNIDWDLGKNKGLKALNNVPVEILWADNQSDATIASTEAASLLEKGIAGIAGAYASGYSAAVAAQALEYGVPMVCGSSSSASLTDGKSYDFGSIFNRVAANDEMETIEFFKFLDYCNEKYNSGIKKVSIAYINNAYGIHADEMFYKYAAEFGYQVMGRFSYDTTITSADTEAAQIISSGPDVVFHASYIGDLTMFARAYNSYNYKPTLIMCYCGGFQDASFADVATSLGANFYAGGQACSAVLGNRMEVFNYVNGLYKAKTGFDIDGPALEEFASIIILTQAIEKKSSTKPADIIKALREGTFEAPYLTIGFVEFNNNGQNTAMASFITQLINGKYEVVFPIDQFVTREPILR
jgi:branched-chain amino acid transport system substrate-binding protein